MAINNQGYFKRVLVAVDQAANVILGGHPDETISARSGREAAQGVKWAKALSWVLNKLQYDHTDLAIAHDDQRAEAVENIEQNFEATQPDQKKFQG